MLKVEAHRDGKWTMERSFKFPQFRMNGVLVTSIPPVLEPREVRQIIVQKPLSGPWRVRLEYGLERSAIPVFAERIEYALKNRGRESGLCRAKRSVRSFMIDCCRAGYAVALKLSRLLRLRIVPSCMC